MLFTVATWNVNSIKVRLPHVVDYLSQSKVNLLALQEIKCIDDNFPLAELQELGYEAVFFGEKQYNGVAIICKHPMTNIKYGMLGTADEPRRFIACNVGKLRIINVYVPNGESLESDKYIYKLSWLEHLQEILRADINHYQHVMVMGDFNIAPADLDVYDATIWQNRILVSEPERQQFQNLLQLGLFDSYRQQHPHSNQFSWWNYRNFAYKKQQGLRIDHILCTKELLTVMNNCDIDENPRKQERPSDHTVVWANFAVKDLI